MIKFLFSNRLKPFCYVAFLISVSFSASAGTKPDTSVTDSLQHVVLKKTSRPLLAPAVMMSIGALALEIDVLQDINRTVRHHVLATKPNVNNNIEDHIRHIPTASTFILLPMLGIKSKNNFIEKAMIFGIATTIGDQVVSRVKTASKHLRPDGSDRRSFPSGHTTTAFVAAEFMRKEYQDVSPWLVVAGYTAATATGALRVYHNKHWLTDVVAGAGLGIISTDLAYLIYSKTKALGHRVKGSNKLTMMPSFQSNGLGFGLVYRPN